MKIITLNTWGGQAGTKNLLQFFEKYNDIDIFCLQEIFNGGENNFSEKNEKESKLREYNLFNLIQEVLPDHQSFFRPHLKDHYGLAMFIKKDILISEEGEYFVHKDKDFFPTDKLGFHARNIQYVTTKINNDDITILNFHGLWNGQGKSDTEDRINQSKKIISFIKSIKNDFILCGDFNLSPDTKSLQMIEQELSVHNLISEYDITSTRTSLYTKENKYADYVFTSKNIKIKKFEVLSDEVSDHAPILIEID